MSFHLAQYQRLLQEQVLPQYAQLGKLAFAYLQGSLVNGYTDQSDLDIVMVWDQPEVPGSPAREEIVVRLDERKLTPPFVVDYRDVHLEQWVIAGQECSVGHWSLVRFEPLVQSVLAGRWDTADGVLNSLVAVSGFYSGKLLLDSAHRARRLKAELVRFPVALKAETARVARVRQTAYLADLRKFADRADWFMFHSVLVEAVRTALQALFAAHEVYYPGDKWLRLAIARFGLEPRILDLFDQLWQSQADPTGRIDATEQLLSLAAGANGDPHQG
jgi:hypothetical protein